MKIELLFDDDLLDDLDDLHDLEVLGLLNAGLPRQIYQHSDHFHDLSHKAFFVRFRLKKDTVLQVLEEIEEKLQLPYDENRHVSAIDQLLLALRYYATGNHLRTVDDFVGLHKSTACKIIKRVSEAIASLRPIYVKFPTTPAEIRKAQLEMYKIAKFPRVLGALDTTHIPIKSPDDEPEAFRNRKQYFSLSVQAVSDANLRFTNIVARWPGSVHDTHIFNMSRIRCQFEAGEYGNGVLLGDNAYPIKPYLLTPIWRPEGNAEERYNEAHARTRQCVDKLFCTFKQRFPVNAYGYKIKLKTAQAVIVATVVLYNIARNRQEEEPPVVNNDIEDYIKAGNIRTPLVQRRNNKGDNTRRVCVEWFDSL